MQFSDESGSRLAFVTTKNGCHFVSLEFDDNEEVISKPYMGKYYVHPDSLAIHDPIEHDLIDLREHGFAFVTEVSGNNINCALFHIDGCEWHSGYWHRKHIAKIIQRNGKAFHWPESEELI